MLICEGSCLADLHKYTVTPKKQKKTNEQSTKNETEMKIKWNKVSSKLKWVGLSECTSVCVCVGK